MAAGFLLKKLVRGLFMFFLDTYFFFLSTFILLYWMRLSLRAHVVLFSFFRSLFRLVSLAFDVCAKFAWLSLFISFLFRFLFDYLLSNFWLDGWLTLHLHFFDDFLSVGLFFILIDSVPLLLNNSVDLIHGCIWIFLQYLWSELPRKMFINYRLANRIRHLLTFILAIVQSFFDPIDPRQPRKLLCFLFILFSLIFLFSL